MYLGNPLPLSSLFILSVFHPDSVPRGEDIPPSSETLQRKRMSFLLIHDVGEQDPYAILKVTSESTTQDVIKMALAKASILHQSLTFNLTLTLTFFC